MTTSVPRLALFSPLLLALTGGCVTKALWNNGRLDAWKEPSDTLNLRLWETQPATNLFVMYNEFSERGQSVRARGYWLNENQARLDKGRAPRFASVPSARNLIALPVFYDPVPAGVNLPDGLCAVVATNKQSFTLHQAGQALASHDLPVYNDGKAPMEKAALTPLAVTADLTIVGAFAAYLYALENAGYVGPTH